MAKKIYVGAKVASAKHGAGTISKVITPSTGYVEVTFDNGSFSKEMAFNLCDGDGNPLKSKPKSETSGMTRGQKKRYNDAKAIAAFDALTNLQKIKQFIMWINGKVHGDAGNMTVRAIQNLFIEVESFAKEKGNTFVIDVMNTIRKTYNASEKQAYVIAKFADDNGIVYDYDSN